jgi:hypothetical protein
MKLHGVVTGVQGFGVFVGFYGGVSGLMPKAHLDLLPGQAPGDMYSVGQLLRCQVGKQQFEQCFVVMYSYSYFEGYNNEGGCSVSVALVELHIAAS